jgi:hypothetical protein
MVKAIALGNRGRRRVVLIAVSLGGCRVTGSAASNGTECAIRQNGTTEARRLGQTYDTAEDECPDEGDDEIPECHCNLPIGENALNRSCLAS